MRWEKGNNSLKSVKVKLKKTGVLYYLTYLSDKNSIYTLILYPRHVMRHPLHHRHTLELLGRKNFSHLLMRLHSQNLKLLFIATRQQFRELPRPSCQVHNSCMLPAGNSRLLEEELHTRRGVRRTMLVVSVRLGESLLCASIQSR